MREDRLLRASGMTAALVAVTAGALALVGWAASAADIDPRVLEIEKQRIEVIAKVQPAVVAVIMGGGTNGGSGVIIDKEGYALTNFHVVAASGPTMKCGLPDGQLYDAVIVGLDKVGDIALIKILPKKEGDTFPCATLGDSDKLQAGEWSLAMGNPFLLATDFKPTVTFGLVSGVHRYQYPEGGFLEYTDCIQIDTSINPGNSGGPLFNMAGELIGINGRGSFDKRSRINSGVGYAISINQIKNFLGQLYSGINTDHASLFSVRTDKEEGLSARVLVSQMTDDSEVYRRGVRSDDQVVEFGGRPITTANQFKNVLGIYPRGWRVPLLYRHEDRKKEVLVRLAGYQARELDDSNKPKEAEAKAPPATGPAAKFYDPKPGLANAYFNNLRKERLMTAFRKTGDFSDLANATWTIEATVDSPKRKAAPATITMSEEKDPNGKGTHTLIKLNLDGLKYDLDPLKEKLRSSDLRQPTGSGGLLLALYQYRQLLAAGEKGFVGKFQHGGVEPIYPPKADGTRPARLKELRVDGEVLNTEHAGVPAKWFFSQADQKLIGFEVSADVDDDSCDVFLADYREVKNGDKTLLLPHRIEVRTGNDQYGVFNVKSYQFTKAQ